MESRFLTSVARQIFLRESVEVLLWNPIPTVTQVALICLASWVSSQRPTDPTPVVTRPGAGPASAMVTRSHAREGRSMDVVPGVEFRPETEFGPEMEFRPEMNIPAEILITCDGGFGTSRSSVFDTAGQKETVDRPETTAAFTTSRHGSRRI